MITTVLTGPAKVIFGDIIGEAKAVRIFTEEEMRVRAMPSILIGPVELEPGNTKMFNPDRRACRKAMRAYRNASRMRHSQTRRYRYWVRQWEKLSRKAWGQPL